MSGWPLAVGAGLSALGGAVGGAQQAAAMAELLKKLKTLWNKQAAKNEVAAAKSEGLLKDILGDIEGSYGTAKKELAFAGQSQKQGAQNAYQQALGQIAAQSVAKGTSGTSIVPNAQLGAAGQLAQQTGAIDQATGQQFAQLALNKAAATSTAKGALADFYPGVAGAQQSWLQTKLGFLQGQQPQNPYAGIGQSLGSIFGAYYQGQLMDKQGDYYDAMAKYYGG